MPVMMKQSLSNKGVGRPMPFCVERLIGGRWSAGPFVPGILIAATILLIPGRDNRGETAERSAITGVVRYQADAARPWRYARYYVSKNSERSLSSAVVCLKGRSLKGLQPPESPAQTTIDQQDYRFIPEVLAIRSGDSVKFTNSDAALHNVQALAGTEPLNVTLSQDGFSIHKFERAGNSRRPVRIGCAFHSQMQAWIYVFDHPFFAVTSEDGKFQFDGLPSGDYDLEVIHPSGNLHLTRSVHVDAAQALRLELTLSPDDLSSR